MDAAQRSDRARLGAHAMWAKTADRAARTEPGRSGLLAKFEREAREMHPDADDRTIALAVESLKQAHCARMRMAKAKGKNAAKAPGK
jgi:hypothetical protein